MKKLLVLVLAMVCLLAVSATAENSLFDDFNRPDGLNLGNSTIPNLDWQKYSSDVNIYLENGTLVLNGNNEGTGYFTASLDVWSARNRYPVMSGVWSEEFDLKITSGSGVFGSYMSSFDESSPADIQWLSNGTIRCFSLSDDVYGGSFTFDVWHHYKITYINNTNFTIYQDNVSVCFANMTAGTTKTDMQYWSEGDGDGTWMVAYLDNWVWYNDTIPSCIPSWNCTLYGFCNASDQERCIEVEDLNACNETYGGNYTEFGTQECDFCTPDFYCSDFSAYCPFHSHLRECLQVTDTNGCYPQTNLSSDNFDGNFTPYAEQCGYISQYSTTDLKNEVVDMAGGGAMEVMYWVRVIFAVFTITFVMYGLGRMGLEKLGIIKGGKGK